jgi:hypothetical protein
MEQELHNPNQSIAKPASKQWKWVIFIFIVADFWGIWYYLLSPVNYPTFSGPDQGYYQVLRLAKETCGDNVQLTIVSTHRTNHKDSKSGASSPAW